MQFKVGVFSPRPSNLNPELCGPEARGGHVASSLLGIQTAEAGEKRFCVQGFGA